MKSKKRQEAYSKSGAFGFLAKIESRHVINMIGAVLVVAGLLILYKVKPVFFSLENIKSILTQTSTLCIMAFGLSFVLVAGSMDISLPIMMLLSAVVGGLVIESTGNIALGIVALSLTSIACGAVSGFFISKMNMLAFMTTLVMQIIASGIANLLAQSRTISLPAAFTKLNTSIGGILPIPVFIMAGIGIILHFVLKKCVFGRSLFAIGINKAAADTCGIPVSKYLFITHILATFMAGFSAIIMMSRLGSVSLMMVTDSTGLDVVCAAIVGGASIYGGSGSIMGAFLGSALISTIQNIINLFGIDTFTMYLIKGAIILICTYIDMIKTRMRRVTI